MIVTQNDVEGVRLLIEAGADVNARTDIGSTPLHRAIGGGNVEIVRMLLDAGALPDLKNNFGETAWTLAEHKPNRDELRALIGKR